MKRLKKAFLTLALLSALALLPQQLTVPITTASLDYVRIFGVVNKNLTLTYADLLSFTMVSEVANLKCVVGLPDVTYNWTGVPLFHLLTLAEVKPEAYKVVTRGSGGFSSDLLMEEALKPTTILALGANGTVLPEISGIQGFFRLVVPCKWGYKWVGDVEEIEVVDNDYKGTYESTGIWSDEADRPGCGPLPSLTPPLQTFNFSFGNRTFQIQAFTNASVIGFNFDYLQKKLELNTDVPSTATGFANLIIQQDFLRGPYNVSLDDKPVDVSEANVTGRSYLNLAVEKGLHTLRIVGTDFFGRVPGIAVDYNRTAYVGEPVVFDASRSADDGQIVSYEWIFGDGTNGSGALTSHTYAQQGTYGVKVNVTDNDGLSSLQTLTVTVANPPERIPFIVRILLLATLGLLILMFVILLLKRNSRT